MRQSAEISAGPASAAQPGEGEEARIVRNTGKDCSIMAEALFGQDVDWIALLWVKSVGSAATAGSEHVAFLQSDKFCQE